MDIDILKMGFKAYLEQKGKTDKDDETVLNSDISLFTYSDDFKEFIEEKLGPNSVDIKSKNVDEILKMEFTEDGKLVEKSDKKDKDGVNKIIAAEELEAYESAINGELSDTNILDSDIDEETDKNNTDKEDMFTAVFNEFLQDEEFKKAIDTDNSGKIDEEEFKNFVDKIKGFDKEEKDISIDDLLTAAAQIKNGVFNISPIEAELNEQDKQALKEDTRDIPTSNPLTVPSRSNVGGASIPSGGYSSGVNTYNPAISVKSAENMSESELQAELTKAKGELSEKQTALSAVIDGSAPEIKSLQDSVNSSYETYQSKLKEVDEVMAKQVDNLKQKIDSKQKEINEKDIAISQKENDVSNAENSYNNVKSSRENLESILSELKSSNSNNNDVSSQISEISSKLSSAKKAEENAQKAVETAKKELEKLKEERKELESGESGLNKLKEEITELEADIAAKYPEVQQSQQDWEQAKENLETGKAQATQKAQAAVSSAQDKVNKLETELTELKNNEAQSQYNNQYNESCGNRIANAAHNVPGTVGRCLAGVADTLDAVYGAGTFPPIGSAYQAADILASNSGIGAHFTEVQVAREDLPNLPAGAIVVWNNNANGGGSNVSGPGRVHGHISVALGDGRESSDHIQEQIVNRDATFRVFYPKS